MGRTGHQDDHGKGEEERGGKRFDLSPAQVAGAGAATLAAATAASFLNVYGTVIGAAGMAALSTLVSPMLQDWFSRSGEQARQLAGRAVRHNGNPVPHAPGAPVAPAPEGIEEISETALLREAAGTGDLPEHSLPEEPGTTVHTPADDPPEGGSGGGREGGRRGWRSFVVPAVAVFVLAMLVILVFELFTGRSLTSWTRGADEPTAPTLFGGTTSAPPAQEEEPAEPGTTGEAPENAPWTGEEDPPGTGEPTAPAPGGGAPGDGGDTEGGAATPPAPADPPADGPEDPGEPVPDPGTGQQDTEGQAPAPEAPGAPPE